MSKPWSEIIAEARARGWFTEEDCEMASHWPTCACGQLDADIPRNGLWRPMDVELYRLGTEFGFAVDDYDFDRAKSLITAITDRAAVVLAEMALPKESDNGKA